MLTLRVVVSSTVVFMPAVLAMFLRMVIWWVLGMVLSILVVECLPGSCTVYSILCAMPQFMSP